jgi:5-hydroxyisourate hydrolase-like protein (transthyretin family)
MIGITGCLHSSATGIEPGEPGKKINEIAGSVLDAETRKPLKEVVVTAYSSNKKEKFVITDEAGRFDLDDLKTGTYKLVFEKDGYRKVTKDKVVIKTDETFQMRIEMTESEGFDLMPSPFLFFDTK